jgi:hypothetical protein
LRLAYDPLANYD